LVPADDATADIGTNGNLAGSLGLVLLSIFLSPLTTPISLHSVALMASGD
jgi:BASS family bile acid:Na+ symporter